ncbi:Nodulation protein J [Sterolibacterium denitrificans]|uniref:Nodulation protein J n=2 Tax=Sterolibacterium denitrificans TaxID=157592 RepID=A0A7Z7HT33_9PROT|nr:ABC transporter permease [Sterolibacterium denitrificans]KYC29385.1 nodulation protein NodJ [Sterolibacterium denitrificans]SMB31246.1 Nodulation protein J [Sterolibacterium denitrificans]
MQLAAHLHLPRFSLRAIAVWRRNFLVWRKLALTSVLGNLADPMIYLFGLGYGLGSLLPEVGGVSYIVFLASGTVCSSTMNAASFETLYSGFSRMHVQKTWDAILNAPLSLDDVLAGECLWAASKATLSGLAILAVVAALGLVHSPLALWAIPVIFCTGLAFAALGLIVTALARSYDFFMYYFTLFVTPMTLLCGVFFPIDRLPAALQGVATTLPLAHSVLLIRPLLQGSVPQDIALHVGALLATALLAYWTALLLIRRRLLG